MIVILLGIVVVFSSCLDLKDTAQEFSHVFQASVALQKYYQSHSVLPASDNELEKFCKENQITLDLSKFSELTYTMAGDTAIAISYQLNSNQKIKGSMNIPVQ